MNAIRVSAETLRQTYKAIAAAHGADPCQQEIFAWGLLRADLRGHQTQGIGLLPYLDELFRDGVMRFGDDIEIVRDAASVALIDGHRVSGHVVAATAMDLAIAKARETGIGLVTVRNSSDCGMASNYSLQALEQGMIGIAMSTGPLLVAPWGGREAQFCTNPLSFAVPAGDADPIVVDMATSANSMGAVVLAARDRTMLGGLDVVDRDGRYTNDPARVIVDAMDRESRMDGALLPAGHKGFGMLLLVETLSALLSSERDWTAGAGIPDPKRGRTAFYSQTCIAISVAHFQPLAEFLASSDRMVTLVSGLEAAEGFDAVRLHGARAAQLERYAMENGVDVRDEEWRMLRETAARLDLSLLSGPEAAVA